MSNFVTPEDIIELTKHDVKESDITTFIQELVTYFNSVWIKDELIKKEIYSLDQLNKDYLLDYPSTGGYHIIDDSFTGPTCPVNILSSKSKALLGYFYGINLR
jgi:hypothetical protein